MFIVPEFLKILMLLENVGNTRFNGEIKIWMLLTNTLNMYLTQEFTTFKTCEFFKNAYFFVTKSQRFTEYITNDKSIFIIYEMTLVFQKTGGMLEY